MEKLRSFRYALLSCLTLGVLIQAQDQSGFISIDCGIPASSGYNDEITGIKYISDETFIDTGTSKSIAPEFQSNALERQFNHIRSFPEGTKNCYTLNPAQGQNYKYLLRARFMYANYDGRNNVPQFDLFVGDIIWDTIKLDNASSIMTTEIIHVPPRKNIYVYLVNTGLGTPFISSLELRLLKNSTYETQSLAESLWLLRRYDFGSITNKSVRYKDDIYDRLWMPKNYPGWKKLSTSLPIDAENPNAFRPAPAVMSTAVTSENVSENFLIVFWEPTDPASQYYVYMHFCEVEVLLANQTREFNITQNGKFYIGPIVPTYLYTTTALSSVPVSGARIEYIINATERSTLQPILNAMEIYMVKNSSQLLTDEDDVDALRNIKSTYGVKRNWQGDPCVPKNYWWDGLNCSYEDNNPSRIISLDLSNNSLSGTFPEFLSKLPSLRALNLKRNKLTGSLPADLVERSNNGVDGNTSTTCSSESCKKKKHKFVVPVVVSVAAFSTVLFALAIFCGLRRRNKRVGQKVEMEFENRNDSFAPKSRQFAYSEIQKITNNFERVLGKGGFGEVYHGSLDDNQQVAVKMLSSSSAQGYKEFHAEVKLLMRVHHRNLTALIGYCIEGNNMGLIYEYMASGTLDQYLKGKKEHMLNWVERLQIAVDSAQGLEYLHYGCKPPIVHRDVKSSNILLNEKLQAKIADFGLSRIFSIESGDQISTAVAGTPGYLDPEYYVLNWLNEKSDVYSFGVVLLEIITGRRPVISRAEDDTTHISQWVNSMLAEGDIRNIVDPSLQGNFDNNSAWKAVELALACASHTSSERPTMTDVLMELKECLSLEIVRNEGHEKGHRDPRRMVTLNLDTESSPSAR
ncbi:protein kinase domain-containing protein [Citrus sinensis]|nr:protein kinase domain-containing protein [Citrus sinensis]